THLVCRIEVTKFHKTACQAKSHRSVVGPSTCRQAKRTPAGHISHGRKTASFAKLDSRTDSIAASQSEKAATLSRSNLHRLASIAELRHLLPPHRSRHRSRPGAARFT